MQQAPIVGLILFFILLLLYFLHWLCPHCSTANTLLQSPWLTMTFNKHQRTLTSSHCETRILFLPDLIQNWTTTTTNDNPNMQIPLASSLFPTAPSDDHHGNQVHVTYSNLFLCRMDLLYESTFKRMDVEKVHLTLHQMKEPSPQVSLQLDYYDSWGSNSRGDWMFRK